MNGVETAIIIPIDRTSCWTVYHRLQELAIPCQCGVCQPLRVEVESPATAIQLWCVLKQVLSPRRDCADWLELCWQKSHDKSG